MKVRCEWATNGSPVDIEYHDTEWDGDSFEDQAIGYIKRGSEQKRLCFCGIHHLLFHDAGRGNGKRSFCPLLQIQAAHVMNTYCCILS